MSVDRPEVGIAEGVAGGEGLQHAFVFYSLTPGRCGYGPNLDELCGAMRPAHSPPAERRQKIRDIALQEPALDDVDGLIVRVTQVRLTDEIIKAASGYESIARATLEAAGFEVIE